MVFYWPGVRTSLTSGSPRNSNLSARQLVSEEVRRKRSVMPPAWNSYLPWMTEHCYDLGWSSNIWKYEIPPSYLMPQVWWAFKRSATLFPPLPHPSPSLDGENDIPSGAQELLSTFRPLKQWRPQPAILHISYDFHWQVMNKAYIVWRQESLWKKHT